VQYYSSTYNKSQQQHHTEHKQTKRLTSCKHHTRSRKCSSYLPVNYQRLRTLMSMMIRLVACPVVSTITFLMKLKNVFDRPRAHSHRVRCCRCCRTRLAWYSSTTTNNAFVVVTFHAFRTSLEPLATTRARSQPRTKKSVQIMIAHLVIIITILVGVFLLLIK
jgi:hypothetical protein